MSNTYTKLRDGSWGVRVENTTIQTGAIVNVTKRDGSTKAEEIDRVLWQGQGVSLCSVVQRRATGAGASSSPRRRRPWRPCGYPGCSQNYCDECDGEGG